jgi:molybdate transport system substrate-binding protein
MLGFPASIGAGFLVFAAASLTDALQEIAKKYEDKSGDKVRFSFGASSILARQIQEGARADLFFSADEEKMDQLQRSGLIRIESRRNLLSNSLVLVVPHDSKLTIQNLVDLQHLKRIAVAEPSTVPAGIYARQTLEDAGLWNKLKILPTENVRAALLAVEGGNVDAGIVYKTDATLSRKVKVAFNFTSPPHVKIAYPVALIKEGRNTNAAALFIAHLQSADASEVFERHGFIVLADHPRGSGQ